MGWILFAIGLILFGFLFIYLGYKEIRNNSTSFNLLDTIGSLFMGNFELSGIGGILFGLLFIIVGDMILLNGGPAT